MVRAHAPLVLLTVCGLLVSCSDYSLEGADRNVAPSTGSGGAWSGTSTSGGGPPEQEVEPFALPPAVTPSYVFVANGDRGTVTRIQVPSLEVITVEVGTHPETVATTPDGRVAVTYNSGSDDVSIIDAESLEVQHVSVLENLNKLVLSPDGRWAIVYHDADEELEEGPSGGIVTLNQVSIVNLDTLEHTPVVVGSNPHDVSFALDQAVAAIVADDFLAILDLTGVTPERSLVEIAPDPLDPPRAEEVLVTPDAAWALVRQFGADELAVVDLVAETVDRVPVGAEPTDLDLSPDGRSAVVVDRGGNRLYVLDLADPLGTPATQDLPEGELLGSISFSSDLGQPLAVLYTTSATTANYTVWDIATNAFTVRRLEKPLQSVALTPTGNALLVFHQDVDLDHTADFFRGHPTISLVDVESFLDSPMRLEAPVEGFANSQSGEVGYVILEGTPSLQLLVYEQLLPLEVELRSVPLHVGVFPGTEVAYVNEDHELGRMTFFDPVDIYALDDDIVQTITGFELNSGIEH